MLTGPRIVFHPNLSSLMMTELISSGLCFYLLWAHRTRNSERVGSPSSELETRDAARQSEEHHPWSHEKRTEETLKPRMSGAASGTKNAVACRGAQTMRKPYATSSAHFPSSSTTYGARASRPTLAAHLRRIYDARRRFCLLQATNQPTRSSN